MMPPSPPLHPLAGREFSVMPFDGKSRGFLCSYVDLEKGKVVIAKKGDVIVLAVGAANLQHREIIMPAVKEVTGEEWFDKIGEL